MMAVQMDKMSAPSSRERAQRLYDKNIELENKRRRSAQARIPSDPNAWQQIRENYEAILLEDYGFSEQHTIEYALWQLHYRRIEELRAHLTAALASSGSNTSQGAKVPARPDRIAKISLQFKTFLSEATGFYHDLILKIRSKYGLPLGYFSEDSDNRVVMEKDGQKYSDMKKGLISCHRCLIYMGDLARYKGLYGDGDSKTREHAVASSYYLQAASLWPSNGNAHHQLAILASYSGDMFVTVYQYFRSLAVDNPFSTARDNLIVAFEKNRQSYIKLIGEVKISTVNESSAPLNKGIGKWEAKPAVKDTNSEANFANGKTSSIQDMYKSFCIRFVRLNGILFTHTSLETFARVLSSVRSEFCELLSSGPEEELSFGADVGDNALFIIRLISILVFTVHNVKKEAEGQTYAEIVQRAVLLQNSFTAVFDLMGCIMERFVQLRDPSSSYLLPGILVFMEWLACCPDVASGTDADVKQAAVRLSFWNHCVSFLNKILSFWSKSLDDNEDDTCFYKLTHYEEGGTGNRLALWEDFELRGFLPLLPAQTILDFSRKHSFGSDGSKENVARVKRILAAGKALANVARIDQKTIFYDSRMKKFVIGVEPQISDDGLLTFDSGLPKMNGVLQEIQAEETVNIGALQPSLQPYDGDEEDEVIVFRPAVSEKGNDIPNSNPYDGLKLNPEVSSGDMKFYNGSISAPLDMRQQAILDAGFQKALSSGIITPQHLQPFQPHSSKWLMEEGVSLANSLKAVRFMENGHAMDRDLPKDLGIIHAPAHSMAINQPATMNPTTMFCSQTNFPEARTPSRVDITPFSGIVPESYPVKMAAAAPAAPRKSLVGRPVRQLGPPPGFTHVPPKSVNDTCYGSDLLNGNLQADDYSWLDGYQLPSSTTGSVLNSASITSQAMPQFVNNSNGFTGTVSFPFPGKQVPPVPFQTEKQKGWQNYQALERIRLQQEQQMQQQLLHGNQQFTPIPEQYHGKSIWGGRYIV